MKRIAWMATGAATALFFMASAAAQSREPGDLWEVTTEMQAQGMAIPATTSQACQPRNWTEPPGSGDMDKNCKVLDFKTAGNSTSWKIRCEGSNPMTGSGEITRQGKDAYSGVMRMTGKEGEMTMKMRGRRIGDCDAGEVKRQIAAAEAAGARQMAQVCAEGARNMQTPLFVGADAACKDPKDKDAFCRGLRTESGFAVAGVQGVERSRAAAYCGTTEAALRDELCVAAERNRSFKFLGENCPAQAQALGQRECAGRSYTALSAQYRDFCTQYARSTMAPGGPAAAAAPATQPAGAAPSATDVINEGAKALKGILGF